ncbi:nuclear pore complex protein NUP205 isoform X1, partial [Tanacetum coccineum]
MLSTLVVKFKQSLQNAGPILPEIQGDAKALVVYLCVLRKVVENGNPIERKTWFPDIEPLFKLLSYENVPPYLKGALRDSIATLIHVSPILKDTIWGFLEQYDLPVLVGPQVGQLIDGLSAKDSRVFAKGLLDVVDNLDRASSVVKESFAKLDTSSDSSGAVPL